MLADPGVGGVHGGEAVGVLPARQGTLCLGVGEAPLADIAMNGQPAQGQGSKPEGKLGPRSFAQGFIVVDLGEDGRWGQLLQGPGVGMEQAHGFN